MKIIEFRFPQPTSNKSAGDRVVAGDLAAKYRYLYRKPEGDIVCDEFREDHQNTLGKDGLI